MFQAEVWAASALQLVVVWSWYLETSTTMFYAFMLAFGMRCIYRMGSVIAALTELLPLFTIVLLLQSNDPWHRAIADGPQWMLYAYASARVVLLWTSIDRHVATSIHKIRSAITDTALATGGVISVYYLTIVDALLDKDPSLTLRTSTIVNNSTCNVPHYEHAQVRALYDDSKFTPDCAWEVWRRNRINLLAMLQIWLVYVLLFRFEKHKHRVSQQRRVHYICAGLLQALCVFFAVTMWIDRIYLWYKLPVVSAVLFSVSIVIRAIMHIRYLAPEFVERRRQHTWHC